MKYQQFKYIIFILLFSFNILIAKDDCLNNEQIIEKLQTKYKVEIAQLNVNKRLSNDGMLCKVNNDSNILVLLYDNEIIEEEGIYDLSIIIAEVQDNKIIASSFISNLFSVDNSSVLTDLMINLEDYQKFTNNLNIGLILERSGSSSVNHFVSKQLFIFEKNKKSFNPILWDYSIYKLSGVTNGRTCQGEFEILNLEDIDYNYPKIKFNFNIINKIVRPLNVKD